VGKRGGKKQPTGTAVPVDILRLSPRRTTGTCIIETKPSGLPTRRRATKKFRGERWWRSIKKPTSVTGAIFLHVVLGRSNALTETMAGRHGSHRHVAARMSAAGGDQVILQQHLPGGTILQKRPGVGKEKRQQEGMTVPGVCGEK